MDSVDATRARFALLALYLSKAEARDKICRTIQYGSKFISGGEAGVAQQVDKSTSLARKVFRLLKSVNELEALLKPTAKNTPLPLVLLGKSKNALMATFLALDQVVWAGRTGIYKNKERTELISKISLYCYLGGCTCNSLLEASLLMALLFDGKKGNKEQSPEVTELQKEEKTERLLNLIKASLDIVVAIGLLQLAPNKVTPRVTGAFGFVTSLISCYQLFPPLQPKESKVKAK